MGVSVEQLEDWMLGVEDEHLEFKEAKNQYNTEKVIRYCSALANERGGKLVLGVTNKKPRRVVGTNAFAETNSVKAKLVDKLRLRVETALVDHPAGRVLVFEVPSRPIGMPIACDGAYLMRSGEDLVSMTPDMLGRIFDEAGPDFSAETCPKATIEDLDPRAVENMREMWIRKSGNEALYNLSMEQLLTDAELLVDGEITYAALVLLGNRKALGRYLPQPEVIFEYRSNEAPYRFSSAESSVRASFSSTKSCGTSLTLATRSIIMRTGSSSEIYQLSTAGSFARRYSMQSPTATIVSPVPRSYGSSSPS